MAACCSRRARQALRCLPFRLRFYEELEASALSSGQLAARTDWHPFSRRPLSANQAEDHLHLVDPAGGVAPRGGWPGADADACG